MTMLIDVFSGASEPKILSASAVVYLMVSVVCLDKWARNNFLPKALMVKRGGGLKNSEGAYSRRILSTRVRCSFNILLYVQVIYEEFYIGNI
jgi:hypothetical protein